MTIGFNQFSFRRGNVKPKAFSFAKEIILCITGSLGQKRKINFSFPLENKDVLRLLKKVIESFSAARPGIGLPLGNLTSQLFVNVYMNEFDQFVKHEFKAKYYIRYADDFVLLSENRGLLQKQVSPIRQFLKENLSLELHPDKIFIKTLASGVDFLGWVHFPDHRVLRTTTKRRMFKRLKMKRSDETLNSYLGLIKHGNTNKLRKKIFNFMEPHG